MSQVPRRHRYYESTTTSPALYLVTYGFASRLRMLLAASSSLARSTERRAPSVAWGFLGRFPLPATHAAVQRISQVPGRSILYLCPALRSRPSPLTPRIAAWWVLPPLPTERRPQHEHDIEIQSHGFSTRCLRFVRDVTISAQDSLPAGCWPLPGGSRTLWIAMKGFRWLDHRSPFPGFACR